MIATNLCAVGFPHEIVQLFDSPRDWPKREFPLVSTLLSEGVRRAIGGARPRPA